MKGNIPTIHTELGQINIGPGVSFSEIPEQVRERSIKEGFVFNLLVIGRRGLGSSTLINSLFSAELIPKERTEALNTTINEIIEDDVKLTISVTTYHGEDFEKILEFIENLNKEYFELEQGLSVPFHDRRIHCCLYLTPSDKMTESEISGLKEVSEKANTIPIITKADMFTVGELKIQRRKINEIFEENKLKFYDYGEDDTCQFPMAIIASESIYEENGYKIRGRKYPWGSIDIENKKYSDFKKLQKILIGEKFIDLISETDSVFYNEHRKELMKNETPIIIKQRLAKIVLQLEKSIEEKYKRVISELKADESVRLREKVNELSFESSNQILPNE
jgi:septin 7